MQSLSERHLSALALGTYDYCPLRFRFRYIDNLYWSKAWGSNSEERKAIEKGDTFHLMARRYYAGLDPAQVADPVEQTELDSWLHLLTGFLPRTFDRSFYPELELRLNRPDLKMQAKFDLVVVDPNGRATIFDWKTQKKMPKRERLSKSFQTLVYRFMLCAAGGAYSPKGRFRPDEISMIYWNPLYPHRWERLDYAEAQYTADEQTIRNLVALILRTPREGFRATTNEKNCQFCEYRPICHGGRAAQVDMDEEESLHEASLSWDTLPELP